MRHQTGPKATPRAQRSAAPHSTGLGTLKLIVPWITNPSMYNRVFRSGSPLDLVTAIKMSICHLILSTLFPSDDTLMFSRSGTRRHHLLTAAKETEYATPRGHDRPPPSLRLQQKQQNAGGPFMVRLRWNWDLAGTPQLKQVPLS